MSSKKLPIRIILSIGIGSLSSSLSLPARSLDLTSSGWQSNPSTPGACPDATTTSCYSSLTASSIDLIGPESISPPSTYQYSYSLPTGSSAQRVSFNYNFDPSGNFDSTGSYRLGSNPAVNLIGSGSVPTFVWNPGETLFFSVAQVSDASWAGTLSISSFSSTDDTPASSTPVPAPLPLFGAASAFGWSRSLRRRLPRARGTSQRRN